MSINEDHSILELKEIEKIKSLKEGQFSIPNLDFTKLPDISDGEGTVKRMATNMTNYGYKELINEVKERTQNSLNPNTIFSILREEHEQFKLNPNSTHSEKIFHLIQLWGGNEARMFYIKGTQLNKKLYFESIDVFTKSKSISEIISQLNLLIDGTKYFNISFATKHINLWQELNSDSKLRLPIYDNIMAINVMGKFTLNKKNGKINGYTHNDYKSLEQFWRNFVALSEKLNVPTTNIERNLFNFFRNLDKKVWPRIHLK
jgi:hypothetical protein